jgi:hypothetical protein
MSRHKAKSPYRSFFGHGFADDHLEIGRSVGPTADIAAIDADRYRRSWIGILFHSAWHPLANMACSGPSSASRRSATRIASFLIVDAFTALSIGNTSASKAAVTR